MKEEWEASARGAYRTKCGIDQGILAPLAIALTLLIGAIVRCSAMEAHAALWDVPLTALLWLVALPASPESPPLPPLAVPVTTPRTPVRPPCSCRFQLCPPLFIAEFWPVLTTVASPPLPAQPEFPPVVLLVFHAAPVEPVAPVSPELPDVTAVCDVVPSCFQLPWWFQVPPWFPPQYWCPPWPRPLS